MFGNPIKLCIPQSKLIIEKSSNTNTNNLKNQYKHWNFIEFVGNTNNINKLNRS